MELHVEQGPRLAAAGRTVAAVDGVVGLVGLLATFEGGRGHAGTTPMDDRADALRAAARLVLAVADAARAEPGAVGTVGDVRLVSPASNIVPGAATVLVDLRAPDDGALARVRGRPCIRSTNEGAASAAEPCSLPTTQPIAGRPPRFARLFASKPLWHWKASCTPAAPTSERMKTSLSAAAANLGRYSQIW